MEGKERKIPHIGMRTLKSGIAVALCLLVYEILGLSPPFYACIAAVICMQSSVRDSLQTGIGRMIGTLIGGGAGIFLLFVNKNVLNEALTVIFLPLGVILCIYICSALKRPAACAISAVVLCAVMIGGGSHGNEYIYAVSRIIETAMGIFAAFMVNRLIAPQKEQEQ